MKMWKKKKRFIEFILYFRDVGESSEGLVNKEAVLPHEYINNLQDPVSLYFSFFSFS
jgi:hypothetical protein